MLKVSHTPILIKWTLIVRKRENEREKDIRREEIDLLHNNLDQIKEYFMKH